MLLGLKMCWLKAGGAIFRVADVIVSMFIMLVEEIVNEGYFQTTSKGRRFSFFIFFSFNISKQNLEL